MDDRMDIHSPYMELGTKPKGHADYCLQNGRIYCWSDSNVGYELAWWLTPEGQTIRDDSQHIKSILADRPFDPEWLKEPKPVSPTNLHDWNAIKYTKPPQKTLLMVTGSSGYVTHPQFLALAYYDEEFRPSKPGQIRWLDVTSEALSDRGWYPTHWALPIRLPRVE